MATLPPGAAVLLVGLLAAAVANKDVVAQAESSTRLVSSVRSLNYTSAAAAAAVIGYCLSFHAGASTTAPSWHSMFWYCEGAACLTCKACTTPDGTADYGTAHAGTEHAGAKYAGTAHDGTPHAVSHHDGANKKM